MRQLTDITLLVDRSASMQTCHEAMEESMMGYIRDMQQPGKPPCVMSYVQFDTEYDPMFTAIPIETVGKIVIQPRGGTALIDALGKCIDATGARLSALPEYERPDKVLIITVTDGDENASKAYIPQLSPTEYMARTVFNPDKFARVRQMLERQKNVYNWTFTFLGAGIDAIGTATNLGISKGNALNFDLTNRGMNRRGTNYAAKAMLVGTQNIQLCSALVDNAFEKAELNPDALDLEYAAVTNNTGTLDSEEVKKKTIDK